MIQELYEMYYKDVYVYIYSLCHNESLSEDLTSETFYQVICSLPSFRKDANIKTWIFSIARNVTFKTMKKRKKEVCYDVFQDCFVSVTKDYDDRMHQIYELIKQLPKRDQLIFHMKLQGYSYVEIAEQLKLNPSSVRVIDYRNRKFLKEKIGKEKKHE